MCYFHNIPLIEQGKEYNIYVDELYIICSNNETIFY